MRHVSRAIAVIAILAIPLRASAWWTTGHMVIAEIAYRRLNVHAKAEVDRLIAIDALKDSNTFVTASCWADDLKALGVHAYDEWHYVDMPFSPDGSALPPAEKTGNVEWAIDQCVRTLKSGRAPDVEKARMLRFLIHFVGDIHQPLHCSTRVTKEHPTGDRGGNDYLIKGGKYRNVHMYWDAGAGMYEDIPRPLDATGHAALSKLVDEAMAACPPQSVAPSGESPYHAWVEEGLAAAKSIVYTTPENAVPPNSYQLTVQAECRRRVATAGYRLAEILNRIYP